MVEFRRVSEPMRVLIVGCGYVGLSLARALVAQGHVVYGLRRGTATAADLDAAGVRPIVADIGVAETLRRVTGPFEWVVNCVASPLGGGLEAYRHTYGSGTVNLLAWLEGQGVQHYVYTSSTGVYGQDDGRWVDETAPTQPESATA